MKQHMAQNAQRWDAIAVAKWAKDRLLWVLGILLSVAACGLLIQEMWGKWTASPVLVAMDDKLRFVWEIPFPAITVCPLARHDLQQFNFTDALERYLNFPSNTTDEDNQMVCDLSNVCNLPQWNCNSSDGRILIERLENNAVQRPIRRITFNEYILFGKQYASLMTSFGLCSTFNSLPGSHIFRNDTFHASRNYWKYSMVKFVSWNSDKGYDSTMKSTYPRHSFGSGPQNGLKLQLKTMIINTENYCTQTLQGYQITLHSPETLPRVEQTSFIVSLGQLVHVSIIPVEVTTNEEMRTLYTPDQRQCFFSEEKYLRFFKVYSQRNCEFECISNITLVHCGCVTIDMPRLTDTPVCGRERSECVETARKIFQLTESKLDVADEKLKEDWKQVSQKVNECDCKQSCSFTSYNAQRAQGFMEYETFYRKYVNTAPVAREKKQDVTFVDVYFKESTFVPVRRMELYGTLTFLANCGCILGLCLGFSILSVIEIIYWIAVRPFGKIFARKRIVPINKRL